ncbi:MAG: DUF4177 domain-containing protein [Defluviitaleaceae bacterium]|nr:DUF4177 domain-containing protein [Defluviitaleaceae bacterium]
MYNYKFIEVKAKTGFVGNTIAEHRELIEKAARQGYRYVGYVPTKLTGHGMIKVIDLVFEKPSKL